MNCKPRLTKSTLLLSLILLSCDDIGTGDCGSGGFCDITECGAGGLVDPDDWRPVIIGSTDTIRLEPACPNPAATMTRFWWASARAESLVITICDRPNNVVRTLASRRFDPGNYILQFILSDLKPDIYRVYFSVVRGNVVYTTWGDIKVVR